MSQARPDPTEIAGRYQVIQKLGAGAFGTVYKAKDKILGRMLAIKTIRLEGLAAAGASLEELLDRFNREARVSAQLKHPNIVTIYDVGDADGLTYLAMEFIDGAGLEKVIAAGKLAPERAAAIGAQVADALDFAHRSHIVHRDVKPANIMLETGDRVKVTDFGIAKVTDSGDHLTMTGSLLGTPSYMSPEQAKGAAIDGRSDLFAVGCILYEMVTGQKAFRGDSITGLIFKIITEEPPAIRDLVPDVPEEMLRIIQRALAKTPEGRYQSGRELADDLMNLTQATNYPTLRQNEVDTARAVPGLGPPTLRGQATQAGTPPTQLVEPPTRLVSPTPPAAPPAVDPTRLTPPPPPPPPAPRAAAPPRPPADPTRLTPPPPRAAAGAGVPPQRAGTGGSKTGLLLGLVAAGLGVVLLAGVAAVYVFVIKPRSAVTTDTGPTPEASLSPEAVAPPSTTPSSTPTPEAEASPLQTATTDQGLPTVPPEPPTQATPAPRESARPPVTSPRAARREDAATSAEAGQPDLSFLDAEPAMDGREAGGRVAETYRSPYGRDGSSSYGASRPLKARAKIPPGIAPAERVVAFNLLSLVGLQEVHKERNGRYGTFAEILRMAVPPHELKRHGWRFELTADKDEFKIVATPLAIGRGRPLLADDSGFVRFASE